MFQFARAIFVAGGVVAILGHNVGILALVYLGLAGVCGGLGLKIMHDLETAK